MGSIVAPLPSPYPPVAPLPCGPPGPLTSSSTSSSVGIGLAGNSNAAGPIHHYAPYHVHHVADASSTGVASGASALVNSSGPGPGAAGGIASVGSVLCGGGGGGVVVGGGGGGGSSPVPYTAASPHHYAGHPAAVAAAAAAAYHHHHHHHFASANAAYHPYSYNYNSAGATNGHSSGAAAAYAHYPAGSSSPSALELTRRKMISRSPVSASWRSNSPSPWEIEGYTLEQSFEPSD